MRRAAVAIETRRSLYITSAADACDVIDDADIDWSDCRGIAMRGSTRPPSLSNSNASQKKTIVFAHARSNVPAQAKQFGGAIDEPMRHVDRCHTRASAAQRQKVKDGKGRAIGVLLALDVGVDRQRVRLLFAMSNHKLQTIVGNKRNVENKSSMMLT